MSDRQFIVEGADLPRWSNPISHAVVVNNMCFISGQLSVDVDGQYISGSVREEVSRAFSNVFAVAKAAGFAKEDIVFIELAVADLSRLGVVDDIYMSLFEHGRRPARTVFQAEGLPFGGKIKIVATAVKQT